MAATTDYSAWMVGANALMAFGLTGQVVNAAYGVLSDRYEAKSKASQLESEATIAAQNARLAELDAQQELRAGEQQSGQVSLQYGQLMGQQRATVGASGTVAGVGTNAEVLAATEFAKQADLITIDANATRAANAARMRGVNEQNRARMARVGARSLRSMSGAASPGLAAATSLIGGAGMIAGQWAAQNERREFYRSRGGATGAY